MMRSATRTTAALVRASHLEPSLTVTLLASLLAVAWDAPAATTLVVGTAALSGQLGVGWSNDLIDRDRDARSGRLDKPLASGAVSITTVRWAIGVALLVTIATSLSMGPRAGLLHLALVATGWGYNGWLKCTTLSWLPYAVCFGGLPVVVSLAVRHEPGPVWMVAAGAILGTGAHLVNALPDLDDDRRTGVVGLPHRLGARRSIDVAMALLLAGSAIVAVVPISGVDLLAVVTLFLCGVLLVVGRLAAGRVAFRAVLGIAVIDVVALLLRS